MFIYYRKITATQKRYLDIGLTELATKCSPPFSPSAFASTKLVKKTQNIFPRYLSGSVNNVLPTNCSVFKEMQTLDKVTNFSLNQGFKIYNLCHCIQVFHTGGRTFSLTASIQVLIPSSLVPQLLSVTIKGFKNKQKETKPTQKKEI